MTHPGPPLQYPISSEFLGVAELQPQFELDHSGFRKDPKLLVTITIVNDVYTLPAALDVICKALASVGIVTV